MAPSVPLEIKASIYLSSESFSEYKSSICVIQTKEAEFL